MDPVEQNLTALKEHIGNQLEQLERRLADCFSTLNVRMDEEGRRQDLKIARLEKYCVKLDACRNNPQ